MALTPARIRSFSGVVTPREVHVPAWVDESGDDTVFVRSMTLAELTINSARAVKNSTGDKPDDAQLAAVIARCVVDEAGKRLFKDDDAAWIKELPAQQAMTLYDAITEESGETPEAEAEIAGNSEAPTGPNDGSSSTSPETSSTAPSPNLRSA